MPGFRKLVSIIDPRYTLVCIYNEIRDGAVKPALEGVKCFSATTDLWTNIASHPYLSLTTQFLFMKKMASVDPYKLFTVKMDDKSFILKEKQFTTVVLS